MKKALLLQLLVLIPLTFALAEDEYSTPFRHDFRQGEVSELVDQAIAEAESGLAHIAGIKPEDRNFENTVEAFEFVLSKLRLKFWSLTPVEKIATDPLVAKEGTLCIPRMNQFLADVRLRKDMAQAFEKFRSNVHGDFSSLTFHEQVLVENMERMFRRSGGFLQGESYKTVRTLTEDLQPLISEFGQNLAQGTKTISFSESELIGVPQDILEKFPKTESDGEMRYQVRLTFNNCIAIVENAVLAQTRDKVDLAWLIRGGSRNTELLLSAVKMRDQIAKQIGYATWADLRSDGRLAENAEGIRKFLDSIQPGIVQKNREVLAELLKIKQETERTAERIESSDIPYFFKKLRERKLGGDITKQAREYFTFDSVVNGMPEVISKFFEVSVSETHVENGRQGARYFRVADRDTGKELGHFETDMFYKEGRDNGFMAFTIPRGNIAKGQLVRPVSIVHGGYEAPTPGKPVFLTPGEVEMFFHEIIGHVMDFMSSEVPYMSIAEGIAWDFIEVPSNLAQNLVLRREVLDIISRHYQTGEKLPEDLRQKILEAKRCGEAIAQAKQLFFAMLDFELHVDPYQDVQVLTKRLFEEIRGVPLPRGATDLVAVMNHVMEYGYDAGLYGYELSESYSDSLWEEFEGDKLWKNGRRYRETVLAPQGSRNPKELMREFKGRPLTNDAFFRKLGIEPKVEAPISQDGTLEMGTAETRADISANLPREIKRLGIRRGENIAAEEGASKDGKKSRRSAKKGPRRGFKK